MTTPALDHGDVLNCRTARIRGIRAMAGRATLSGPKVYKVADLEGPLLDLAVAKARGLKAVIHLVDNAISPFYECCVLNESGRLQYQFMPSRSWTQMGAILDENDWCLPRVNVNGATLHLGRYVADSSAGFTYFGDTPTLAAARAFVANGLGAEVTL